MTMSGCIVFLRWKKKTHLCCVLLFSHFLSVLACLAFILLLSLAKQTHHLGAHWKAEWRTSCNAAWKYLLYLKFIKCFTGFIVYTACYKRCRQSCASYRVRSTVALTIRRLRVFSVDVWRSSVTPPFPYICSFLFIRLYSSSVEMLRLLQNAKTLYTLSGALWKCYLISP